MDDDLQAEIDRVSNCHTTNAGITETPVKPEYDATKGQLVCPHCGKDCGGWCEPGDHRYADDGEFRS